MRAAGTMQQVPTFVDTCPRGPHDHGPALLAAFDRLAAGEALVLVTAADPHELLELLQRERKGRFEWSPVACDGQSHSVEVTRRKAPAGSLRRVTEALESDHHRLDALKARAFEALRAGDAESARRSFRVFQHSLDRHMRFEEQLLFPVFEMRARLPYGGPTSVMRAEHRQIQLLVQEIAQQLANGGPALESLRPLLDDALADHHRKEETILYPWTDRLLTDGESDKLVAQTQAFGEVTAVAG